MHRILQDLKFHKPHFKINSAQIEILKEPIDFYVNLHRGIRSATRRIVWSSLYIGQGNLEDYLIESLSTQQKKYEQMRISILLDYYRGTRVDHKNKQSSQDQLSYLRMSNLFSHNMRLGFMRHPLLPPIADQMQTSNAREIFNVHHMKWYIFDDKVLLTGANLQEQYFVNRQDRYMVLHEVPEIADYLDDAQSAMFQHGYTIDESGNALSEAKRAKPYQRRKYFKEFLQTWKLFKFSYEDEPQQISDTEEPIPEQDEQEREDMLQYFQRDIAIETKMNEKKEQATQILSNSFNVGDVQNIINRVDKTLYRKEQQRSLDDGEDAYMFITLQIPYLQTDEDAKLFSVISTYLFSDAVNGIYWATGYMNFTKSMITLINNSSHKAKDIKLLTASPSANGFYKAGRAKSYIPYLYRVYETYIDKPIFEYNRPGWTFHVKGIWAEFSDNQTYFTAIGSSNYSNRSANRDSEIQAYIISQCPRLKAELTMEKDRLFGHSNQITQSEIEQDKEMKLTWKVKLLARLLRSYL